jgi:hypothetical protein
VSIETTQARADAALADSRWHGHRQGCPPCITAYRARKPAQMCIDGAELYRARKEADAELARQRELDLQPIPGQGTLWP